MYATGSRNGPTSQLAPWPVPAAEKMIDSGLIRWKSSKVMPMPADEMISAHSAM